MYLVHFGVGKRIASLVSDLECGQMDRQIYMTSKLDMLLVYSMQECLQNCKNLCFRCLLYFKGEEIICRGEIMVPIFSFEDWMKIS